MIWLGLLPSRLRAKACLQEGGLFFNAIAQCSSVFLWVRGGGGRGAFPGITPKP